MNEDNDPKIKSTAPETSEPTDEQSLSAVENTEPANLAQEPAEPAAPETVIEPTPPTETEVETESQANEPTETPAEPEATQEAPSEPTHEAQPEQTTTSGGPGGSKLTKILIALLILLLIGALGYAGWKASTQKTVTVTKVQAAKQPVKLIRVGVIEGPLNSFYPSADGASFAGYQVNNQIYEGLVKYEDVSKITPSLATSWTNPDDSTWIFNLKPGVKFHNGNRMTAADVKSSLENYNQDAYGGVFTFEAKEITVISDNKIKIVTSSPDPLLLNKLAYLAIVDSNSKASDPQGGTGPYTVKSGATPSENELDLVAFSQFHGGTPLTKQVTWKLYATEDELVKDVTDGKIDYTTGIDIVKNLEQIKQNTKFVVSTDTGIGVSSLGINVNKTGSPLKDPKFRQAVALAIDKEQVITDSNLEADPAEQVVTEDIPGYNPAIPKAKPDLEAAKKALAESGYPNGASFTILYDKGTAQDQIDSITKQLKQINVTVKQSPYTDFDALIEKAFSGTADSYFLSYTTDLFDSSDALSVLFQNPNYDNPKLDDLLESASVTIDPSKRLTDLKDASKLVIDDAAEVPIYSLTYNSIYRPDLDINRDTYYSTYFWQVYKKD